MVLVFILSHLTKSVGSIEVEFTSDTSVNINAVPPGSHVILSGGSSGIPLMSHPPPLSETESKFLTSFGTLDPSTKYTVTILSPDLSTVTAHGTFTTPLLSSSPAPLTN